ncbi:MAG: glycosyltransferase family 1 protein [Ardenticatenia bacterium]|nr:glycosyltransferase family 1 protein [Ardenticatenia bacterium]
MKTVGIDASRAVRARRTGTERYAWEIIHRLATSPDLSGVRLRLYTDRPPTLEQRAATPGAEWVVLPIPRLWTHLALAPELLRRPPDLFFEPAHVLPLTRPPASVVTVHDLGYEHVPGAHPPLQRWYLRLTTRWHVRGARLLLADSRATKDDVVKRYGADAARVRVVYPGVDVHTFRPVRDPRRLEGVRARYAGGSRYVLYVGTLQPRKNVVRLVRAFARLAAEAPDAVLVLAGRPGWHTDPLERTVRALGLERRVRWPGYIPEHDLPALLSGAELFAFPSLFEGFGFPVIEAQACGTPVLTSTTSSLPEVAGEAAWLVNPEDEEAIADGLVALWHDKELRRHLAALGMRNAQRFTWERTVRGVQAAFEELLRGESPGPP